MTPAALRRGTVVTVASPGMYSGKSRPAVMGLIQAFEFSHELAWNLLKDYLQYQGIASVIGSRDATRLAFQNGLILDGGPCWRTALRRENARTRRDRPTLCELSERSVRASERCRINGLIRRDRPASDQG